jgi:predicted dienelactone hydrolase
MNALFQRFAAALSTASLVCLSLLPGPAVAQTLPAEGTPAPDTVAVNRIDQIRPDAPALAPFGAYAVGVKTLRFTNSAQPDVANATADGVPTADREIATELWYPAADDTPPGGSYTALLRDGLTEVVLQGSAARDAMPFPGEIFPLLILSHGYPGNRFLLSHLGENLASKGYVVASIDHPDSTYADLGAFGSTLLNRPADQRFVLDSLAVLENDLGAIIDADRTAVIGYSMGGYGALIFGGAGVTEAAPEFSYAPPDRLLARHVAGSETYGALVDERVKAVVAFAPWGRNTDFWDADGLSGLQKPLLLIAGSADDVSLYPSIRRIFEETTGTTRHLLTFENANHNAGAPIPAPAQSWKAVEMLDFSPFDHYADPVWDTVRMNNISQHFLTAFLDLHLKGDEEKAAYLDLIPVAGDGVIVRDEDGVATEADTYWTGFPPRTAIGLRFETLRPE